MDEGRNGEAKLRQLRAVVAQERTGPLLGVVEETVYYIDVWDSIARGRWTLHWPSSLPMLMCCTPLQAPHITAHSITLSFSVPASTRTPFDLQ